MVDKSVEFFDLFMLYDDLSQVEEIPLPDRYSFRYFDGSKQDIEHWKEIEASSGDVESLEAAHEGFDIYFAKYINTLLSRTIFVLNSEGLPVGTATAFFLVDPQPGLPKPGKNPLKMPSHITGHLHWVAIREEYKGKGLSKPMITKVMKIMKDMNHKGAFLHTQTPSWLACKIYLDLGWKPFRFVADEEKYESGWNIVKDKINKDFKL